MTVLVFQSERMATFVDSILSTACRRDVAQNAIKTKLRGRRLLLEHGAHTVAPGDSTKKRRTKRVAARTEPLPNRKQRRMLLLSAAKEVTFPQLQKQHAAWMEYAKTELRRVSADRHETLVSHLDWHGASVRVVRSASEAHANCSGLVLTETRRMLLLLSESRRVWVPKAGTSLELCLPDGGTSRCEAERPYPPAQVG